MHPQHSSSDQMTVCNLEGDASSPRPPILPCNEIYSLELWVLFVVPAGKWNNKVAVEITFNSITTNDKSCSHGIHKPLCLYMFSASLSNFLSPDKVFKNFLHCIGHSTTTGLIAECTKITTQSREKHITANYWIDDAGLVGIRSTYLFSIFKSQCQTLS